MRNQTVPCLRGPTAAFYVMVALAVGAAAFGSEPTTTPTAPPAFDASAHLAGDPLGLRTVLAQHGVTVDPSLIADDSKVFRGGLNTRFDAPRYRFALATTVDAGKLLNLPGGTAFALFEDEGGPSASTRLVGDVQNITDNTYFNGRDQLAQLWYQQELFNGLLRAKAGKVDAGGDFDVLEHDQEFLNNSFSNSPTIVNLPSDPDPAIGVNVFVHPVDALTLGAGVYDGSLNRGVRTGSYGPSHFFDRLDDLFFIGEADFRYTLPTADHRKLDGKIGAGGWYSTDAFPTLGRPGRVSGNGGAYVLLDQVVWRLQPGGGAKAEPAGPPGQYALEPASQDVEDPRSVAIDFSYGHGKSSVDALNSNVLFGVTWIGPLPWRGRDHDAIGVGATEAGFSRFAGRRHSAETALEAFYRVRLTSTLSLTPDLQYVFHPNGGGLVGGAEVRDALVGTIRLELAI